ncbi:MAG: quinone-dependent dihydroorotate dehydrogenase, partial [Pseudomonadales bacterium]|nr:quinone-dependent dihydroorotate dehydrogenase [Pseudomonadales bacterium]
TTIDRAAIAHSLHAGQSGGLSGAVLFERSTEVVRLLAEHLQGQIAIVGVGGIDSAQKAVAKLEAGADLVQLYSGLIYQGPALVGACARAARNASAAGKFESVAQH